MTNKMSGRIDGLTRVVATNSASHFETFWASFKDLHVNTALVLYIITYVIFEVPANVSRVYLYHSPWCCSSTATDRLCKLILYLSTDWSWCTWPSLKRFDPQFWLPLLTFAWGVTSVSQGLITNQAGLFGIRIREWCRSPANVPVSDTTLQCLASPKQAYFLVLYSFFQFITYGKDI